MKFLVNLFLVSISVFILSGCDTNHEYEGAHVHGSSHIQITVEDSGTGFLSFESPAMDMWGFGHRPTTDEDKQKQERVQDMFRNPDQLFSFPEGSGCQLIPEDIKINYEEKGEHGSEEHEGHHGTHSDLDVAYRIECTDGVAGKTLSLHLGASFPSIQHITVDILAAGNQRSEKIQGGNGKISL